MTRPVKAVVVTLLAILLAVGAWQVWERYSFDAQEWRAQRAEGFCGTSVRQRMVGDLKENHLHRGMTKAEIRRLLGKPDGVSRSEPPVTENWRYALAPSLVDCNLLWLDFDARGRLARWYEGEN